ncbi:coproporphyrinogen-III oxidase family protein, partial [Treponema sp.]|uniref:coproporphyrinogen-III oxidase family protein n=1 Tax=Treponema sp. TaxID=166 RepID=UPI0038902D39
MISSLYIHIPFCKKKCDYCDFFSIAESERRGKCNDLSDLYIDSLLKEIQIYAKFYEISAWRTVYAGGGTPSLLSCEQILKLIEGIKNTVPFTEDCEITFEVNPDDVTENFLEACKKSGINRLSMGIQAFDDKALKAVNRGADVQIIENALEKLKNYWNGRLSVDFIAGLPNHTYKAFESQFEILKKYSNIDHVSLYTLTVEENTPLWKKIEDGKIKFSYEKADKMWLKGRNILEKMGFLQY